MQLVPNSGLFDPTAEADGSYIKRDVFEVLREDLKRYKAEVAHISAVLAEVERRALTDSRRCAVAEEGQRALYDVVRLLAEQVANNTYVGRAVRKEARLKPEEAGIVPPFTLGSSRCRERKVESA